MLARPQGAWIAQRRRAAPEREASAKVAHMRFGLGSLVFIGVMLGAAGLSLVRVLLVAAALPKLDFGTYAAVTATGAFFGNIISFGSVEGTVKTFPRLVALGRLAEMRERAHGLFGRLAMRSLALGVPLIGLGLALSSQVLIIAGAATLFALSASYTSLVASMQRAVSSSSRLAGSAVFRAVMTLVAVVITAHFAGLFWTLVAEAASTIMGCYLSERIFLRSAGAATPVGDAAPQEGEVATATSHDGFRVFLTYTVTSAPFYLDRIYVTATMGPARAAEYALLALFLMAASLLINAIAQRVGADAIKMAIAPNGAGAAARHIFGWCGIGAALWAAVLAVATVVLGQDWLPAGLAKYQLDPAFLLPIGVLGALQASVLLEYLLLALDQERRLLGAAICYFAAIIAVAGGAALSGVDLYGLIWLLAAARLLYCVVLTLVLRSTLRPDKASAYV